MATRMRPLHRRVRQPPTRFGVYSVSATFTGDLNNSPSAIVTATLTITQATPAIVGPSPAAITYGTALSAAQLNATTTVTGTFAYSPAAGTVLSAGSQI